MRRKTNIERLKAILRSNTDVSYYENVGIADDDFYIYLTNGQKYLVREGYYIDWVDNDEIRVEERSMNAKKNMQNRIENSKGLLDGVGNFLGGMLEAMGDAHLADKVDIDWIEVRDIQSV